MIDNRRVDLVAIDLDLIDPNPWQPRTVLDLEELADLAKNISLIGLLQEPLLRPSGERYQLAFGHRRLAALEFLRIRNEWSDTVLAKVADLTDEQMAYAALSENKKRKDLTAVEEIRAWAKAIEEIDNITIQGLADRVGVDRTTMSKNLTLLELPEFVLEYVADDRMSVRAARELLTLRTTTHAHEDQMVRVLYDCGFTRDTGPPDFRVKTVRSSIRHLTLGKPLRAWGFPRAAENMGDGPTDRLWRRLDGSPLPSFDVEAFKAEHSADVHLLPSASDGDKGEAWTCNVREWRRRSAAATRERNKALGATQKEQDRQRSVTEEDTSDWLAAIKRDPVVQAVLGAKRTGEITNPQVQLEPDKREALGTRIRRPAWPNYYDIPDDAVALPLVAHPKGFKPPRRKIGPQGQHPPMFDFSQCATCVDGAGWAETSYTSGMQLVCYNKKAWNDKKSVGIQAFIKWRDDMVAKETERDDARASAIANAMPADTASLLVRTDDAFLQQHPSVTAWRDKESSPAAWTKFNYHPEVARQLAEMIGAELPSIDETLWNSSQRWRETVQEWLNAPPEDFDWPRAAGLLLAWKARVAYGLGGQIPEVTDEIATHVNGHVPEPVTIHGRPASEVLFERLPRGGAALRLLGFVVEHARDPRGLKERLPKTTYGDQVRGLVRYGVTLDKIGVG